MLKHIPNEQLNKLMIKLIDYFCNTLKTLKENNKSPTHHSKKFLNFSKNLNSQKTPSVLKSDSKPETDF